jgi:AraC-like DNA-binding protein
MPELTVAAGLARGLVNLAVSKGADRQALAVRSGIAPADLLDLDNRIPLSNYIALMRTAKELTRDPALALHFGETNDMAEFSVVGLITYASETVGEAFAQLNRYASLVVEFDGGPDRFRLASERDGLWIVDSRQNPNDFYELTESTFARLGCGPRRLGFPEAIKAVHVTHPEPSYRAEYDRIFQVPVTFESDWNAVLIDAAIMNYPVKIQPRYVFGILSERAEALLKKLQDAKTVRGRVETLLLPILHTGDVSMDVIANKMALSRQTLLRRLKAEGTTFEKVLDELRHAMALNYLSDKKVSVNETAYLVGFSEPAAFSRAFKRWTGSSPKSLRDLLHANARTAL